MRVRIGDRWVADWLDEAHVKDRIEKCGRLSRLLERVDCSLDAAEAALSAPSPHAAGVAKAVAAAVAGAVQVKTKFWKPEDRTAYAVEKAGRDLIARVKKAGPMDPKAVAAFRRSIAGLREKAGKMAERAPYWCGLRSFEGVADPPERKGQQ